ncbi:hypothetical protein H0H93_011571 [Arthromyces matolae]|nr:hypothetical protein H0H93_011571 [Arthromyces matolae]
MYQRGSTYVMSIKNGWKVLMAGAYSEGGPPTDVADRLSTSFPHHFNVGLAQRSTKAIAKLDKYAVQETSPCVGFILNILLYKSKPPVPSPGPAPSLTPIQDTTTLADPSIPSIPAYGTFESHPTPHSQASSIS